MLLTSLDSTVLTLYNHTQWVHILADKAKTCTVKKGE